MEYGYKKDVKSFFCKKGSEIMTLQEAYVEFFEKPMVEYINTKPQEIIDYLSSQTESLSITETTVGMEDIKRKAREPEYLNDKRFVIGENSIEFQSITGDVAKFIIEHANKNIRHLSIPNTCLKDITFLSNFPNLEDLTIDGYCKLDENEIEYIKTKTNIKNVYTSSGAIVKYDYIPKDNEIYISKPLEVFISGDLVNKCTREPYSYAAIETKVNGTNIDLDLLEKALSQISYPEDKHPERIEVTSKKLNEEYGISNETLLRIKFNENNEIEELFYNGVEDVSKLREIVSKIEKKTKIHKIILKCQNKSYENAYYLNSIAKKYPLEINYGDLHNCSLEEFLAMRETLDYFNELVQANNLSQAEILMYAYDIMKTFRYKENEEEKDKSRYLHHIVMTDYIVCVGYAKFMEQILKENNMKIIEVGVTCDLGNGEYGGHARNLVYLDDDKYDIHGIYAIDATWDSAKGRPILITDENGKRFVVKEARETDTVEKDYDANALYRHFIVPASEYQDVFVKDTIPPVLKLEIEDKYDEFYQDTDKYGPFITTRTDLTDLFGEIPSKDEIKDALRVRKPSLETFKNILFTVRKAQGYTTEEALDSVEETIELNTMIDELNRDKKTFFQEQASRK